MRKKVPSKLPPPTLQKSTLTPEEEQELDFDVCCCIEEIEHILLSNPSEKQKKMAEVSLKILKNPSEIHIKKKQVMRQWFGDYKNKFEIKKKQVKTNLSEKKFTFNKPKIPGNSKCFRKHALQNSEALFTSKSGENQSDSETNTDTFKTPSNSFRFEF